jgi:hypothetical protein
VLKVNFFLENSSMPRTEYWERFVGSLKATDFFSDSDADLLIPFEDTAMESNWPCYGNPGSAYIRGTNHDLSEGGVFKYFSRVMEFAVNNPDRKLLYISMNPFFRASRLFGAVKNLIVADISLAMFERDMNRRTISMPALPIVSARVVQRGARSILASFQGVNSHPVREQLRGIADGKSIVVNFVERQRHVGKVDAINARTDFEYAQLLQNSSFAFVPRGDRLFSYRLAEVMSFGCIPVILSDGWVLPFDRTMAWEELGLRVHADDIPALPEILHSFTKEEIMERRIKVISTYQSRLSSLTAIISSLMVEAEMLCAAERC